MRRLWLVLALVAAGWLLPSLARGEEQEQVAKEIASRLQCPVCQNLSVADSPTELAQQMREIVSRRLEAGDTREQIFDFFVERYGEEVLLEPPKRGFNLVLWLGPVAILAGAALMLGRTLAQWRRRRPDLIDAESGP